MDTASVHYQVKSQAAGRNKTWNLKRRQSRFALLLTMPSVVMIILFIGYPVIYSFLLTFSNFTIEKTDWFSAGFDHYKEVWEGRTFKRALNFTLYYTAIYVPLSVGLGLLISVLLQQIKIGSTFFRSLLFLPTVIPITMGLLMFQWVLDPNWGVLNHIIGNVLGRPTWEQNWLDDPQLVTRTLIAVTLWGFGPWILMLAGILNIPKELYEAARVDGANPIQEFRYITLPLMRNTLVVVITLQTIKALKLFVPIYILTQGNPATKTRALYYLVFQQVNRGAHRYAYASTIGWIFTFMIIGITLVSFILMRVRIRRSAGKWSFSFGLND